MTDNNLLKIYMQGFNDELNSKFDNSKINSNLDGRAYCLGSAHAIAGDDLAYIDKLTDEEILKRVKR